MNPVLLQIILAGMNNLLPALTLFQKLVAEGRTEPTPEEMAAVQAAYNTALQVALADVLASKTPATIVAPSS